MTSGLDKIICTQDVAGEREWFRSHFSNYTNLETEFGGHWPVGGFAPGNNNFIWEIPPDSTLNLRQIKFEKILSLYRCRTDYVDPRWCDTNQLLSNVTFSSKLSNKKAQVITLTRSGTVFFEKLIYSKFGYIETTPHVFVGAEDVNQKIISVCESQQPDVFVVYRKDLWGWVLSRIIASKTEFVNNQNVTVWVHGQHADVINKIQPFEVLESELDTAVEHAFAFWNSVCHLRTIFRNFNFYIIEYSDLISAVKHEFDTKIPYNKQAVIKNYKELETCFYQNYLLTLAERQRNAIKHLESMMCYDLEYFFQLYNTSYESI